ncbi:MAG TPA: N-acetylmuramoyl-L-alanine amidase, partial [Vicinamibacterales bacterium]|nr:N-acetylmuramoyl-L-alanine amidase [Vicinamibacterales bacterium]
MRSFAKAVAVALLVASTMPEALAQSSQAQRLYQDALERERALRKEMNAPEASPSLLTRIRALVGAYDDMSKLFPSSGFGDNALWQGARLSADAFWQFGEAIDRTAALRLFTALTSRFPASSLGRQVPEHTKRLNDAKAGASPLAAPRVATAPPSASRPVPNTPPASPPVPITPPASARVAPPRASPPMPTTPPASPRVPTTPPASQTVTEPRPRTSGVTALHAIRRDVLPEALRITLELAREVPFYSQRIEGPPRVFIDLQNTRPVEPLSGAAIPFPDDMVKQIRVGRQADARTRVVLDLRGAGRYSIYTLYEPYRIVVDFERPAASDAVAARGNDRSASAARAPVAPPRAADPTSPPASGNARTVERRGLTGDVEVASTVDRKVTSPAANDTAPVHAVTKPTQQSDVVVAQTTVRRTVPVKDVSTSAVSEPAAAPQAEPVDPLETAVVPGNDAAPARPAPLPPSANRNGNFSLSRQLGLGIAKVVIDAGHGGHDPGAQARGLTEADLVLDVALRLEKLMLKEGGFEVVLTRRTDSYVSLEERTAIANKAGADLFLSIHSNASASASARGIETYFLNFAPNTEAEAVAARENAGEARTMRSLPEIVRAIAMNNKRAESRDFASMVQNSMYTEMRKSNKELRNLGVKQAPFMVLVGATMPAVLAEISFITNRQDATLLKTD